MPASGRPTRFRWRRRFLEHDRDDLTHEARPGASRLARGGSHRAGLLVTTSPTKTFKLFAEPLFIEKSAASFDPVQRIPDQNTAVLPRDMSVDLALDHYGTHKTALIHNSMLGCPRFQMHCSTQNSRKPSSAICKCTTRTQAFLSPQKPPSNSSKHRDATE